MITPHHKALIAFLTLLISMGTTQYTITMEQDINTQLIERTANIFKGVGNVSQLLDKGADINCESIMGLWPLLNAVKNDNVPLATLLLQKGAKAKKVGYLGHTALHYATSPQMATLLLNAGANPTLQDNDGDTALHYMARAYQPATAFAVLAYLAKKNVGTVCRTISLQKTSLEDIYELRPFTNLIRRRLTYAKKLANMQNKKKLTAYEAAPINDYDFTEIRYLGKPSELNLQNLLTEKILKRTIEENIIALVKKQIPSPQAANEPNEKKRRVVLKRK